MRRLIVAAVLLLAASVQGQQASYTYIDQGKGGCGSNPNPPWLTAMNLPKIGTTFQVQVPYSWDAYCLIFGWMGQDRHHFALVTGLTNPDQRFCGLWYPPLNLLLTGWVFTSAEVRTFTPHGPAGQYTLISIPIPNHPALMGGVFYQQVVRYLTHECPLVRYWEVGRGGRGVIGM